MSNEDKFQKFIDSTSRGYILRDVPADEYHSHKEFVSKHLLDLFADCPQKYIYEINNPTKNDSPQLIFGEAFHTLMLEPKRFNDSVHKMPDTIKARRGSAWDALVKEHPNTTFLSAEEYEKLLKMQKALKKNKDIADLLFHGRGTNECTVLFRHNEVEDRLCKARIDRFLVDDGIIIDLKTTATASPKEFAKQVARYRYDVQAAFYIDALTIATGKSDWRFAIVAIEKEPPFANAIYFLDDWISLGRETYLTDLSAFDAAQTFNKFEGYSTPDGLLPPPPSWVVYDRLGYNPQ